MLAHKNTANVRVSFVLLKPHLRLKISKDGKIMRCFGYRLNMAKEDSRHVAPRHCERSEAIKRP